ncbi:hypothetical protein A5725_16475 [Mycobacterium kubicae]|nr:hypothetical protein A5725_16475 [Mycobacterium kubicae]
MHRSRRVAVALAVAATVATACGGPPKNTTTSTSAPTSPPPTSVATTTTTTTTVADSGMANGQSYRVTTASITGATDDRRGQWNARFGQISGGDAAVIDAFNNASTASARDQLDQARTEASPDAEWTFESTPTVSFRTVAVAQVIVGVYSAKHAAHPSNYVSTVVIDARTAQPITLATLFANQQSGLNRLSEQTKLIFPRVYGGGPDPMPDEPGNQPVPANFANWIPTSAGLELHFADYQFGHGLAVITVPWSALADVLAPNMGALTHD